MAKKSVKKNPKGFQKGNKLSQGKIKDSIGYDRQALIAKKIDAALITQYITLNSHLTPQQLERRLKTEKVSAIERMLINTLLYVSKTVDVQCMNFVLDRLVGKAIQPIQHMSSDKYDGMTVEQLLQLKADVQLSNEKTLKLIETGDRFKLLEENFTQEIIEVQHTDASTSDDNKTQ